MQHRLRRRPKHYHQAPDAVEADTGSNGESDPEGHIQASTISITVEGKAHAAAEAWKGSTANLVNASVNVLNASVNAVQTAEAGNTNLYADQITITSNLNKAETSATPAAKAEMSAGGGFSGGSVKVNTALRLPTESCQKAD